MREILRDPERLKHIKESCESLLTKSVDQWKVLAKEEPIVFFGIVKQIENIGEASYKLTKSFKQDHEQTEWRVIEGMRHFLVHDYYNTNPDVVWNVVANDIQPLLNQINDYLDAYDLD